MMPFLDLGLGAAPSRGEETLTAASPQAVATMSAAPWLANGPDQSQR